MRKHTRNSTDIPVNLEILSLQPETFSGCKMTSISLGGLSCEVERKVTEGCKLVIHIPSVSPPYHGSGEVAWCRPEGGAFEIGVHFTDADDVTTSRMVQQVGQIEHYKNIVFTREGKLLDGKQAAEQWMKDS